MNRYDRRPGTVNRFIEPEIIVWIDRSMKILRFWDKSSRNPLVILLFIGIVLAAGAVIKAPFSVPSPIYLDDARAFLRGDGTIPVYSKIGYTAFLIIALKTAGISTVFLGQAACYLCVLTAAYIILLIFKVERRLVFFTVLLISFHPYLIFNIKRITDSNLAVPLFLLLIIAILHFKGRTVGYRAIFLTGFLIGYAYLVRPNLSFIFLYVIFILYKNKNIITRKKIYGAATIISLALILTAVISLLIRGRVVLLTSDGAFTFFSGANRYTATALKENLNTVQAVRKPLQEHGIFTKPSRVKASVFTRLAVEYITEHPFQYVYLSGLKIVTFFRPDYRKLATSSTIRSTLLLAIIQTLIALPFPIWILFRLRFGSAGGKDGWDTKLAVPILILYVLPFAVTSVDPRYRLPLDIFLLLDAAACWSCHRRSVKVKTGRDTLICESDSI